MLKDTIQSDSSLLALHDAGNDSGLLTALNAATEQVVTSYPGQTARSVRSVQIGPTTYNAH